jgi:hypothetical protein
MVITLGVVTATVLVSGGPLLIPNTPPEPEFIDDPTIATILEPRGVESRALKSPASSADAAVPQSWLDPNRLSRLLSRRFAPDKAGSTREFGAAPAANTVYPMRTFFCDEKGVIEERVVDWQAPVNPH